MAREYRRLLIAPQRLEALAGDAAPSLALRPEESRYLTRVLRYGPGDRFALLDGQGHLWTARLRTAGLADLDQPLQQPLQQELSPRPPLVLAAAVIKRDFEVVVRMAVELGVDRLIPVLCERTAVQGQLRPDRWQTIAAEAAEQCERLWLPQIAEPIPLMALWDQADGAALRCWATTRRSDLTSLPALLGGTRCSGDGAVWLACGPEGGWSPAEDDQAVASGWSAVQLGPRILRSSTACVAGLSVLSSWRDGMKGC